MDAGTVLNHYQIGTRLGSGGMGDVYVATDTRLGRQVAIKVLPEDVAADSERLGRLHREARLLAQVNHPNIVTIYSIEDCGGVHFITMELVEGGTLDDLLAGRGLPLDRFFELALPLVDAINTAHAKGIMHRDLKPANIMVGNDGRVRVLDFGLAKSGEPFAGGLGGDRSAESAITGQGLIVGTIAYMSPEQAEGRPLDQRSDIFSLGVLLYQMLSGQQPFRADTALGVLTAVTRDEPTPITEMNLAVPRHLGRILRRAMEKDPARRYQSTLDLRNDLADLLREVDSGQYGPRPEAELAEMAEVTRRQYVTPLVAREQETAAIDELLERTLGGSGGMVLIGGEPGVGKTRLAWEMLERARETGLISLIGHCYEREGAPPYCPWVEITETAVQITPAATLHTLLGDAAPEIAKLLPELRQRFDDIPAPIQLPPEESRRYLFKSFREFLERAAALRPLCLVLDDLHWADDSTLLLLQHLAPHLSSVPVMIIGTYRNVELEVGRPFARTLRELVRERLAQRVTLRRLAGDGVRELVAALAGKEPPPELIVAIEDTTEGNPFFVEEVYQHLAEEGRLFGEDGEWLPIDAVELDVPEGVRLVVGRRLEHLEPEPLRILTVAAVAGRRFSYSVLEAVPGVDADVLLDTMERAEQLQLIRPPKGRAMEPRFVFTHELIRQTLLDGLLLPRRQRLHLQIAGAMESVYAHDLDAHAGAIGHHLYQGGLGADADKTIGFLQRSAELFLAAGGFEDVIARCDMALGLVHDDNDLRGARLRMLRGQACRSVGRRDEALEDLRSALPILAGGAEPRVVAECALDAGNLLLWRSRLSEACAVFDTGLASVGDQPSPERCQLGVTRAAAESEDEALYTERDETVQAFVEDARRLGAPKAIAYAMAVRAYLLNSGARQRQLIHVGLEAAAACEAAGLLWLQSEMLGIVAFAHAATGRADLALEAEKTAMACARRIGNDHVEMLEVKSRMRRAALRGDRTKYGALARQDRDWSRDREVFASLPMMYCAVDLWLSGNHEAALEEIGSSRAAVGVATVFLGSSEGPELLFRAYEGDVDRVLRAWNDWRERTLLAKPGVASAAGARARVADGVESLAMVDRLDLAAPWYDSLVELDADGPLSTRGGWINTKALCALAALAGGDDARAIEHFEAAVAFSQELGFDFGLAEARRFYGWMLLRRAEPGDPDRAREMLGEAREIYERLEMPIHAAHAARLL